MSWSPPPTFEPRESLVEGITVYAPRPVTEQAPERTTYRCPQCGAVTRFDVAASGLECAYCGYQARVQADRVGRAADEREFTLEALALATTGWGVDRRELHCDTCGADLAVEAADLTATCPFCASNTVHVREASQGALRPRYLVPFRLDAARAAAEAATWLGQGWMHPGELAAHAKVRSFSGVYLPYWTFAARIDASWRAEVGHEKKVREFDASQAKWVTRTRIVWSWQSGEVTVPIADWCQPGTRRLPGGLLAGLEPFDLGELVDYNPDFLAGWRASTYDLALPDAWEVARTAMRERSRGACMAATGSRHVRNFSMSADFGDERWRYALLPVFVSAYRYQDRVFQILVNGQTGTVSGCKPVAWARVWLAIGACLLPGICAGVIGVPTTLLGVGFLVLVLALILLVGGIWVGSAIYTRARKSEEG